MTEKFTHNLKIVVADQTSKVAEPPEKFVGPRVSRKITIYITLGNRHGFILFISQNTSKNQSLYFRSDTQSDYKQMEYHVR